MESTDRDVLHQEYPSICSCLRGNSDARQIHHLHSRQSIPLDSTYLRGAIEREIEKDMIRQEIIASETARRRRHLLEAEVRRELMMGSTYGYNHSLSFMRPAPHPAVVIADEVTLKEKNVTETNGGKQHDTLPFHGGTDDSRVAKTVSLEKKKTVLMGQPAEENVSRSKRKAKTPPPPRADISNEVPSGNMILNTKKPKEDWSCEICGVNTTSEITLNGHFQGRKHKAKEAAAASGALRAEKITTDVDACAKKNDELESTAQKSVRRKGYIRGYKFWCNVCKRGAYTMKSYSKHLKGKGHIERTAQSLLTTTNECENLVKPENQELVEDIMTEGGNVGGTVDDEPAIPVKLENDELVVMKKSADQKLVEGLTNEVGEFEKPENGDLEYVNPVKPENGELVDKAGIEHENIFQEISSEGKKISTEGSIALDQIVTGEFMDVNDELVDMKESEDQKLVEGLTDEVGEFVKPENGDLEYVNTVQPENGELVDRAGVEHEKIFQEISSEDSIALDQVVIGEFRNEGEVVEPENDKKVFEEDWAAYITEPENGLKGFGMVENNE